MLMEVYEGRYELSEDTFRKAEGMLEARGATLSRVESGLCGLGAKNEVLWDYIVEMDISEMDYSDVLELVVAKETK